MKDYQNINFRYSKNEKKSYLKNFNKLNFNCENLSKYKYKGLLIGDLIYDTYLRINFVPTVDMKDKKLENVFIRAHKIFDEIEKFLKNNKVKCVVPSQTSYINYGLIARLASKKGIPVVKIFSKDRGNAAYRIQKLNSKYINEEPPYYDYKKIFKKFDKKHKQKALKIGKQLIERRVSGHFDPNLPYMIKSSFLNSSIKLKSKTNRKKIIIFPHCYLDFPHRYRDMIFPDFYFQIKFFLDLSKKLNDFEWYTNLIQEN